MTFTEEYIDTVRLLLQVVPDVFRGSVFAMKGGTAINLFVRDLPRLSVDIDVTYVSFETGRAEALADIAAELAAVAKRLKTLGLEVRTHAARGMGDTKLVINSGAIEVKVEVNTVLRGTVLPVSAASLSPATSDLFSFDIRAPILAPDELYGGKLVAALDRQGYFGGA